MATRPLKDPAGSEHAPGGKSNDALETELAGWGKAVLVETRGRISGNPARAAVGFVEAPDGSLLVAAGDPDADWARNLEADPSCRLTMGGSTFSAVAEPLDGRERNAAVTALILKYGTPAERLGSGPAFRLRRAATPQGASGEKP